MGPPRPGGPTRTGAGRPPRRRLPGRARRRPDPGLDGRHQRVLGDLYWPQGEAERAAEAYLSGRCEAEAHAKAGEAAHNQALRALATAFVGPHRADDELDLAQQLLAALDLRATTINAAIASLIRDAGSPALDDRVRALRTELDVAGLTLEAAVAFHQVVLDDHEALSATIARLREHTSDGTYAYCLVRACSLWKGSLSDVDHLADR
ncbi:hypothetical protein ACWGDS_39150 [Streptomyces sp. NPDC055059]